LIKVCSRIIIISATIIFLGRQFIIDAFNISNAPIQGIEGRLEIWNRALAMIQDFPITGIGMGLFGKFADELYPFIHYSPGSIPHAHNVFLQVAVDCDAYMHFLSSLEIIYIQ